ncbi:MAG: hypothetical protein AAF348_19520 [Bacteroidota bacterium]
MGNTVVHDCGFGDSWKSKKMPHGHFYPCNELAYKFPFVPTVLKISNVFMGLKGAG